MTLLNSPLYHIAIRESNNVLIHNINITVIDSNGIYGTYSTAPETDGIDVGGSNIHVYNCFVSNGDDSLTLEDGSNNILFENSTVMYGLGLGIPVACDQKNTLNSVYRNIQLVNTGYGIRIKSCGNNGNQWNGIVRNISYYNISFVNVKKGIDINVYNQSIDDDNGNGNGNENEYGSVMYSNISDITFDNIYGTYNEIPGTIDCSNNPACYGLNFSNINLRSVNGGNNQWECSNNVYGNVYNVTPSLTCVQ